MKFFWVLALILALDAPGRAHGKSLSGILDEVITRNGVVERDDGIVERIQRQAARSADFLATSTAPGFVYRYDPETDTLQRVETAQGPVLVEPPYTIGQGRFDLGMSYLYAPFSDLDGQSLEDSLDDLGSARGGRIIFDTSTQDFSIASHFLSGYATYGVTEKLDVNILLPLVVTTQDLRVTNRFIVNGAPAGTANVDTRETKVGVGDLLLRAKYRLGDPQGVATAALLTLRLPTGDEENFQGLGDVVVTPLATASKAIGPADLHVNVGFDLNADDLQRNRVRYAAGTAFRVIEPLTLMLDVVGSSGTSDDSFETGGTTAEVPRSDVVDVAVGAKMQVWKRLVANVGVLVPITDDGLTAPALPFGGVDVTF